MADCTYRGHRCLVLAPGLLLRLQGEGAPCIEVAAPNGAGPLSLPLTAEHSAYLQGRLARAGEYDDAEMDPEKFKAVWDRYLSRKCKPVRLSCSEAGASQVREALAKAARPSEAAKSAEQALQDLVAETVRRLGAQLNLPAFAQAHEAERKAISEANEVEQSIGQTALLDVLGGAAAGGIGAVAPYVAVAALISAYFLQGSGGDQHPPPAKDARKSAKQALTDLLADLRRRQAEERATEKARPSP
ncbi:hypothetical protein ACI2KH_06200 [Roseomonas mucosa]|uniref:hypothetical protein n=1 Tax=Roseomonas mucosa TaxID=207340 RepID=UPI003850B05B